MSNQNIYSSIILKEFSDNISTKDSIRAEKKMMLAAKIGDAIKAKGWKGKDLAEELKKSPSEISKWLSGTHNFTTDTLWDIEQILNIDLIILVDKSIQTTSVFDFSIHDVFIHSESGFMGYQGLKTSNSNTLYKSAKYDKLLESSDHQLQG